MNKVIKFLKESYEEFQKVTWPSRDEAINLTVQVIGASLLVGLFISGLDYIFKEILGIYLS